MDRDTHIGAPGFSFDVAKTPGPYQPSKALNLLTPNPMNQLFSRVATLVLAAGPLAAQSTRRPITFDDFLAVRATSDPQISPDGRMVLYFARTADLAANRRSGRTYVLPIVGGVSRQFPANEVSASEARWSTDGRRTS